MHAGTQACTNRQITDEKQKVCCTQFPLKAHNTFHVHIIKLAVGAKSHPPSTSCISDRKDNFLTFTSHYLYHVIIIICNCKQSS